MQIYQKKANVKYLLHFAIQRKIFIVLIYRFSSRNQSAFSFRWLLGILICKISLIVRLRPSTMEADWKRELDRPFDDVHVDQIKNHLDSVRGHQDDDHQFEAAKQHNEGDKIVHVHLVPLKFRHFLSEHFACFFCFFRFFRLKPSHCVFSTLFADGIWSWYCWSICGERVRVRINWASCELKTNRDDLMLFNGTNRSIDIKWVFPTSIWAFNFNFIHQVAN